MSLSICFVTAELAPFAKAGGLGDVSTALTRILSARGHSLALFMPLYGQLHHAGLTIEPMAGLDGLTMQLGVHRYDYALRRGRRADGGPDLLLVDCPALFARPGIYGRAADEHRRFVLLMRAALEGCQRLGFRPDIVHCHDWHTALLPLYLRTVYAWDQLFAGTRSVLTIHNLGYQGVIPAAAVADLGLGDAAGELDRGELAMGRIGFLRQGIIDAHVVTTVSPTYAREICTPDYGMGLDGVLRARRNGVVGILNGVDVADWDPERDHFLPHRYSTANMAGKARMKARLQQRMGLAPAAGTPLAAIVSRLNWQKGTDLLGIALPHVLDTSPLQVAALGSGEPEYERILTGLAARYPGRVSFHCGYDEELAHWIEAGSDLFLMPSRYEPCGLNQMYSQRYGTVPVVRRTGGLADSVEHFDPATGTGTGAIFNDADAAGVVWAIDTALAWRAKHKTWERLVRNGMSRDFSWEPQAARYVDVYARALTLAR